MASTQEGLEAQGVLEASLLAGIHDEMFAAGDIGLEVRTDPNDPESAIDSALMLLLVQLLWGILPEDHGQAEESE
jgi:hypothetical protein